MLLVGMALFSSPAGQIRVLVVSVPDVGVAMVQCVLGQLQAALLPVEGAIRHQAMLPSTHPVCFSFLLATCCAASFRIDCTENGTSMVPMSKQASLGQIFMRHAEL